MGDPAASGPALPPAAWWVALASLPRMGPARLLALHRAWSGAEAWEAVRTKAVLGRGSVVAHMGPDATSLAQVWSRQAADVDVEAVWSAHVAAAVGVTVLGAASYPSALAGDAEPPPVLFHQGDPAHLAGPRVAVIGTRRCTRYGSDLARELGHDLARNGVRVVSGLALGIDGAAHQGVLGALATGPAAPPVAVVAGGLDQRYPRRHAALWGRVAEVGLVLGEAPLGCPPEPWRFPARNRIIAALADLVVVVESPERGGSMYTVDEAEARGVGVMAVPGPVRSAASAGTNRLLFDGAAMVRDAGDVLERLGLEPASTRATCDPRPAPTGDAAAVLAELGWQPVTLEQLARRTGLALGPLSAAVNRLELDHWLARHGGWLEQVAAPHG